MSQLRRLPLYPLSYKGIHFCVPSSGIEPLTFELSARCSDQLSYDGVVVPSPTVPVRHHRGP